MHHGFKKQAQNAHRQHKLSRLQKLVARHEPMVEVGARVATGFAEIDAYWTTHVGGGLPRGGLHEIVAQTAADMTAALGFAHCLAAQFLRHGQADDVLLHGQTHAACRDGGQPYAPALAAHGLSLQNLVYLDGVSLPDLLWAGEQALACPSVACTLLTSSETAPDFTHSRRLSLAARAAERPLLLALGKSSASAATTRWRISALPGEGWQVRLEKLRLTYDVPPPHGGWAVYPYRPVVSETMPEPHIMPLMRRA